MVRYLCTNCNYRFVPRGNAVPRDCPYCAKRDCLVVEKNILGDVMRELENE